MLICVAHKLPLVPFYDVCIGMGNYPGTVSVRDLDPFWADMRPVAWGAAGLFVIPKLIKDCKDELIGICSTAKIIGSQDLGEPLLCSGGIQRICPPELVTPDKVLPRAGNKFLVGNQVKIPSITWQYAQGHVPQDLLDYTQMAVRWGFLPSQAALGNLKSIGGGGLTLGYYPREWLLERMTQLEILGREYVTRYRDRLHTYDGYQVRQVEFLTERMGHYFLEEERLPASAYGPMLCLDSNYGRHGKGTYVC